MFFYEASGVFATFYLQAQTAFTVMVDDMDVVSNVRGLSQRLSEYKPSSSVKKVKSQWHTSELSSDPLSTFTYFYTTFIFYTTDTVLSVL